MAFWQLPNIFAALSGSVAASTLDANFNALSVIPLYSTSMTGNNTIAMSVPLNFTAYQSGMMFLGFSTGSNTAATTLNVNGLGAVQVIKEVYAVLAANDIQAGSAYAFYYDGTVFHLINPSLTALLQNSPAISTPAVTGGTFATPALSAETYSTSATVTAGTNAQGQGPLTSDLNVVTVTAAAPSGITLPTATIGRRVIVINKGTNTINIYPATGGTIDALAINTSIALKVGGALEFNASSTTQWYAGAITTSTQELTVAGLNLNTVPTVPTHGLAYNVNGPVVTFSTQQVAQFTNYAIKSVNGTFVAKGPQSVTAATYNQALGDYSIKCSNAGTTTITISSQSFTGLIVYISNTSGAGNVVASASVVVPLGSTVAGTAILTGPSKWAQLQSDGTNMVVIAAN